MEVFTIQIGNWRIASRRKIPMVNTTVRDGLKQFAPTWDMVMGHKRGEISDEAYAAQYRRMMIESMKSDPQAWLDFINDPEPRAIACYCKAHRPDGSKNFCHRYLLVGLFEEICEKRNIEFKYYGELE